MQRTLVAVVCAVGALGAGAAPAMANHSWGNYHWARTSNPFTVKLGDNVSATWDAYLGEASTDWTASSVLDAPVVTGGAGRPKQCRATSGRVEVCNERYGFNGWLGIASIWALGDHITQATVKLNDSYFNTASYNKPEWRRDVTCQEVGHTFGLDHQDEVFDNLNLGTCMDYTNNPLGPPSNEHPNQHDYDQLDAIYAHTDGSTTLASSTSSSGSAKLKRVRDDLWVEDLGGGRKRFVWVHWADHRGAHGPPSDTG